MGNSFITRKFRLQGKYAFDAYPWRFLRSGLPRVFMDWRQNLIANHKAEIVPLREEIRQEQESPGEIGSTLPNGTRLAWVLKS
ncbi:hypothetical protein [Mesorhizobium sp. B2-6-2]|uniref:hypothetical protein n=1 Tax=Mesorhizobium sp. B2-6-2 TaxID=2589915 RepID=UPI0015E2AE41|nr:hypothetical protein [Mesorhizobium sp. B2-6-2]